jgi:hypothetical protein
MRFDNGSDHARYAAVAAGENPDGCGQIVLAVINCNACSFALGRSSSTRSGKPWTVRWKMHCSRRAMLHYSDSIASSSRVLRFAQVMYIVLVGPSTKDRSASVGNLAAPYLVTERANFSTALPRAHAQACLLRRIVRQAGSVPATELMSIL